MKFNFFVLIFIGTALLSGCATTGPDVRVIEPVAATEVRAVTSTGPDEYGRELRDAPHSMDEGMMQELRDNVPKMSDMSHRAIMGMMRAMGPNYAWYVSPDDAQANYGVLLLAHGFGQHGDTVLANRIQTVAADTPTAMSLGMSMMGSDHIQLALNKLAATGVEDVIVVPVVSTRYNTMLRQWDYILGLQDSAEYATVKRVTPPVRLHVVRPIEDHPLVGDALLDYVAEISENPANEDVIIVAHGPVFEDDNVLQLAMLRRIGDYIEARSDYNSISVATLQDDAVEEVRAANVERLRARVSQSMAEGRDVLVITNLLGTRMVQSSLRRDLKGLDYRFNAKGLIEHDNFISWIEQSVAGVAANLN
ncbi:MAG: hypothetical protein HKN56_03110 [Gammaproteobacteria bacterium]|nr:hypothetical protein [Gammaproteobacteria bacterium]NND53944.1 hypothetical protein [Gammaproteobacteria bacterium]